MGGGQIISQRISQRERVAQDVGQFLADGGELLVVGHDLPRGVDVDPLEVLHEFGRLDCEGHREILGGMELLPVGFVDKLANCLAEIGERGLRVVHSGAYGG